jgi:hypothetical protein
VHLQMLKEVTILLLFEKIKFTNKKMAKLFVEIGKFIPRLS